MILHHGPSLPSYRMEHLCFPLSQKGSRIARGGHLKIDNINIGRQKGQAKFITKICVPERDFLMDNWQLAIEGALQILSVIMGNSSTGIYVME